jgi:hypothetical protein
MLTACVKNEASFDNYQNVRDFWSNNQTIKQSNNQAFFSSINKLKVLAICLCIWMYQEHTHTHKSMRDKEKKAFSGFSPPLSCVVCWLRACHCLK